jgi:hypothetical protein
MAKKKIGIYTQLESTPNYKVEDLYLIVDKESIVFSVKNKVKNEFVAFEHFVNSAENTGWHQLVAYLQNNSKLIQNTFGNIHFVWNNPRFIVTQKMNHEDTILYQQELSLVHGSNNDEELYITPYDDQLVILYSVPDALSTLLSRSFPTGKWHHYIEYVMAYSGDNDAFVYLFDNHFIVRLLLEGKTQFVKYFPIEGNDQNAYQLLNACNQAGVVLKDTQLSVWGFQKDQHEFIDKVAPLFKAFENSYAPETGVGASLNTNYPQHIYSTYFIF